MSSSIIIAIIFALIAGGMFILRRFYGNTTATEESHDHHDGENGVCCGKHTNCEKGYDNATVDDIVKKAKCSHGLFYHYFKNKKEIFK